MIRKLLISIILTFVLLFSNSVIISQSNRKPIETEIIVKKEIVVEPEPVVIEPDPVVIKEEVIPVKKVPKSINIFVSYYTNSVSDCGKTDGISASGRSLITPSRGETYVAAPKSVPFGTRYNIEGIGVCVVEDRGGAIKYITIKGVKYMKLDVFVPGATHKQLIEKGVFKTKGYIID